MTVHIMAALLTALALILRTNSETIWLERFYTEDTTFVAGNTYVVGTSVTVGDGATLTFEANVTILITAD